MDQLAQRVDDLAAQMQELTARVDQLAQRVDDLAAQMQQLTARVHRVPPRVEDLTRALWSVDQRLTGEVGKLKGWPLEQRDCERAASWCAPLRRRIRVLSTEAVSLLLETLEEAGKLSSEEAQEIRKADIVVSGRARDSGEERYLLVEVRRRWRWKACVTLPAARPGCRVHSGTR